MSKRCAAKGCPHMIPDSRRFGAKYCSERCQGREAVRRYRKKEGRQEVNTLTEPRRRWYAVYRTQRSVYHASRKCAGARGYPLTATVRSLAYVAEFCRRCTLGIPEIGELGNDGLL